MNTESQQKERRSSSDRLFSAIGHFGAYYAVADIAGTLANHIHTSGSLEMPSDALAITSFTVAAIGAVITDRLSRTRE